MKSVLRLVLGALLGVVLGGGVVAAHFSGRLAPLYHKLGWHGLAAPPAEAPPREHAGRSMGEHAGMPGMDMSAKETPGRDLSQQQAAGKSVPGHVTVQLSEMRQQLIGVRTGRVERDRRVMTIRAVGIIEPDQTRLARVQTRIKGWVSNVFVNYVGQDVKPGDSLLEIYSPELFSTQEEYLIALAQEAQGDKKAESNLVLK